MGRATALRCPECSKIQERKIQAQSRERRRNGKGRALGSTDYCEACGSPYIVRSGNQKMCADCAKAKLRKNALENYHKNAGEINEKRIKSRRETWKKVRQDRTKICPVCGKAFTPSAAHRLYCSEACASQPNLHELNAPAEKIHGNANRPARAKTPEAKRRAQLKYRQIDLARAAGVSVSTLWNFEHGIPISEASREKINRILNQKNENEKA